MKYWDTDTKRQAVDLFERGLGYKAVATQLGVPEETVREWEYQWKSVGRDNLCGKRTRRAYPAELKRAAVRDRSEKQMSISEIMQRYGIANRHQVKEWCKLYAEQGDAAFEQGPGVSKQI